MKRSERRREEWFRLSRAWEKSGQTQGEFCAARGIELGTFRWWRWRLGVEREGLSTREAMSECEWVEVSQADDREELGPVAGARSAKEVRLVFCDGLEVHVPVGFDAETLRRVLSVLGEMAC